MNIQSRIINIFRRHPHYFIGVISSSYPLSINQIANYEEKLLWTSTDFGFFYGGLSSNSTLNWNLDLLNEFSNNWDWDFLSTTILGQCLWFDGILDQYDKQINWTNLSWNRHIPWTPDLLERYEDKIDWDDMGNNISIPWTIELVRKYEDRIDFSKFSNNFLSPIGKRYEYKEGEEKINPAHANDIVSFVEDYEDRLNWKCLVWDWQKGLNRMQTDRIIDNVIKNVPILKWPEEESPF